jgi:ATP-binding protein involved in chromosome partitioning
MSMSLTRDAVLSALRVVQDPDLRQDIVSLGFVKEVAIDGGRVAVTIELTTPACPVKELLKDQAAEAIRALPEVRDVQVRMTAQVRTSIGARPVAVGRAPLTPTVKNIVPIASGKGGVGKSTVSANLAVALARAGARVGLMDADVYGPSIPTLLGLTGQPELTDDNRIIPVEREGVKVISMGFFMKPEEAVIWRGPMLHKTVEQFLGTVQWGDLDYLLVDLPPGCLTGDTLVSTVRGPIPIKDVVAGDTVYSFDGQITQAGYKIARELDATLVPRRVTRMIPQGVAPVYRLRTMTRSIRGTEDHPILTVRRVKQAGSRYQQYELVWEPLARLRRGDIILVVKQLPQDHGQPMRLPVLSSNGRHPITIGKHSSENLLRLVGYFLGDGTLRKTAAGKYWGVWFSEPRNGRHRAKYVDLLSRVFGLRHVHDQPNKFAALSVQVAELFDRLELHRTVHSKRIPEWAFGLPASQKLALIEGYCDADGHRRVAKAGHRRAGWMCFESPNQGLIADFRMLCIDVGLKVGNLTGRTRSIRLPSTGRIMTGTFWGFEANSRDSIKTGIYGAGLIRGQIGQGLRHPLIGFEEVRNVEFDGTEAVYDLQVEDKHNFVADGLIVHNTGDVQLSLCQLIPITGAVVVSTPQDVALNVAQKAIAMFRKLNAPILGIVENMSFYECPSCHHRDEIFGTGGARKTAERLDLPFLGEIPLASRVRELADAGQPVVTAAPDSPAARAFVAVAQQVAAQVSIRGMQAPAETKVSF